MTLNEIALLGLALSLATSPSNADIKKYQSLSRAEQIEVQKLVEQQDTLPKEIEKLLERGIPIGTDVVRASPTTETGMGTGG